MPASDAGAEVDGFAVFIASHRRPDKVYTLKSLRRSGYTGRVFIVIDNGDPSIPEYLERYGDDVRIFNKAEVARTFDLADNFHGKLGAVVFARNAIPIFAKAEGLTAFAAFDDDYTEFCYKFEADGAYKHRRILSLDTIFRAMIRFAQSTNVLTICMAQNGDFLGGAAGAYGRSMMLTRKAMNTFVCLTERPFSFVGRINEDVNTYVTLGSRGQLLMTMNTVAIQQKQTQSNAGGMTEFYLDHGTYFKSFYTVMMQPSSVRIATMGESHRRIHHKVLWRYAVPKIVAEYHRKSTGRG